MAVSVSPYDNASIWGPIVVSIVIVLANLLAWALNEHSWAYRHLLSRARVPKLLFISNRAEGVPKTARPQSYWAFDLLDPHHLVQSPFLNTFWLLVLHACIFLYWVATVLVDVVIEYYGYGCTASWCWPRSGPYLEWMTFLTNWSISILGISGIVGFLNTLRYARRQHRWHKQHRQQQQQQIELSPTEDNAQAGSGSATPAATVPQTASSVPQTAAPGAGEWHHVFHRGGPDALTGPGAGRDQDNLGQDQMNLAQGHDQKQKQQQAGVAQAPNGSDGSSTSGSCDTVVVVGQDAASGKHQHARTEKWDWLSVIHCLLSEVATTAAWFVSFGYWVGLVAIAGTDFRINGGTIMAHAGNFVLALVVLLFTRLPVVSTHFQVLLWYSSLYTIFVLAYGGGSGTWRYGLDVQKAKPAGALILVPLLVFIFFCIWFFVARLRESFLRRAQRLKAKHHDKKAQRIAVAAGTDSAV